ncbi:MAG: hypothetical protein WC674_09705 [Candidatus Krumholzibacteriia bacterium]
MRKKLRVLMCATALAAFSAFLPSAGTDGLGQNGAGADGAAPAGDLQKRWVYISSNLYVDENVQKIEDILRRARAADYTGVLFSDTKTLTWPMLGEPERWKRNAAKVRAAATKLGLELVVCVFPFGYSESFLANDPNLAAGLPIRNAALVRRGDRLVPEQPAGVRNASFEECRGDRVADFGLQDDSGKGSFIDTKIFKEGRASLRFENTGVVNKHGMGRVFQRIAVKPWQQYRIRVWMKTERLTANMLGVVALVSRRSLQYQDLSIPDEKGFRYVNSADDLTTDWVEQSVTFNSLGYSSVIVGAGVWGAKGGKIWWDDLRVDAVPALNVLRRETLPLAVTGRRGAVYEEGKDFDRVADPALGRSRWPGTYDTRHEPPVIGVPAGSRIREGERVALSCYHPAIFGGDQVSCTLADEKVFDLCRRQIEWTNETLAPDGYFLSHDEIRCAGWEPSDMKRFHGSGELLAYNIRRCYEIAKSAGGGKPLYVWSDMFDPNHNARANYYLVNNSFAESWKGLDSEVTVMKWGEPEKAGKSLAFFSRRVKRIMIAGFYDEDVEANRALWARAAPEAPNVVGVMYTTWRGDYSKLEEFARVWWGGARAATERR